MLKDVPLMMETSFFMIRKIYIDRMEKHIHALSILVFLGSTYFLFKIHLFGEACARLLWKNGLARPHSEGEGMEG